MTSGRVLYIEDDADDAYFMRGAFQEAGIPAPLDVAKDGRCAIEYLGSGEPPALVLLDLKLPGMSGFEVLQWIRQQPRLRSVPVIILSSSGFENDRDRCIRLGANDFLSKPGLPSDLPRLLEAISRRWLRTPSHP